MSAEATAALVTAAAALATAAALIVGIFLTLSVAVSEGKARRRSEADARMLRAFELLTGGTQSRSAGIALIEGVDVKEDVRWRDATRRVLISQALYLLLQSQQGDRQDELLNLSRIMSVLFKLPAPATGKDWDLEQLRECLESRKQVGVSGPRDGKESRGLDVPEEHVEDWIEELKPASRSGATPPE